MSYFDELGFFGGGFFGEEKVLKKAWMYVGRFMHGFAILELQINEILDNLFGLTRFVGAESYAGVTTILLSQLDMRKKLKLIDLGLRYQGNPARFLRKLHELHDLRNAIAHSCFSASEEGIRFDEDRTALKSYSELDNLHSEMAKLFDDLRHVAITSIIDTDIRRQLASDIKEIIQSSDNVIRFPRRSEGADDSE
jgi:hypothetical protein